MSTGDWAVAAWPRAAVPSRRRMQPRTSTEMVDIYGDQFCRVDELTVIEQVFARAVAERWASMRAQHIVVWVTLPGPAIYFETDGIREGIELALASLGMEFVITVRIT